MKDEGVSLLGTMLLQRLWILFLVKKKKQYYSLDHNHWTKQCIQSEFL